MRLKPLLRFTTFLTAILLSTPGGAEVRVVHEGKLYGIADTATGSVLVRPRYSHLSKVKEDFYIATEEGRVGVIDSQGSVLIPFNYSLLSPTGEYSRPSTEQLIARQKYEESTTSMEFKGFSKRVETVRTGRKASIRRTVNNPVYREETKTSTEYRWGVIGPTGETLVPIRYDGIQKTPVPGVYIVREGEEGKGCEYGLVSVTDGVLLQVEYDEIRDVRDGTKGKVVVKTMKDFREESLELEVTSPLPAAERVEKYRKGNLYGFRTGEGKDLVAPTFEDAWDFNNGLARVKRGGKWGFVDLTGRLVIDPKYDYVWDFDGKKAKVRLSDGSTGYIDISGKPVAD